MTIPASRFRPHGPTRLDTGETATPTRRTTAPHQARQHHPHRW